MTSPFNWRSAPSALSAELQKHANKVQAARTRAKPGKPITLNSKRKQLNLEPQRFHVYSRAGTP